MGCPKAIDHVYIEMHQLTIRHRLSAPSHPRKDAREFLPQLEGFTDHRSSDQKMRHLLSSASHALQVLKSAVANACEAAAITMISSFFISPGSYELQSCLDHCKELYCYNEDRLPVKLSKMVAEEKAKKKDDKNDKKPEDDEDDDDGDSEPAGRHLKGKKDKKSKDKKDKKDAKDKKAKKLSKKDKKSK